MRVVVFGATGGIGGEAVRQLLAGGDEVIAVVRDASRLQASGPVSGPRLSVMQIPDLDDVAAVEAAATGADAAISGVGPRRRKDVRVASSVTRSILSALAGAGVKRFVAVSAAPVGPAPAGDGWLDRRVLMPLIRSLLRDIYADLALMEREIEASGTQWTVVRPPRLTNRPLTGRYRLAIGANVPRGRLVSRADVAHAMLACLRDPATFGHAVGVAY